MNSSAALARQAGMTDAQWKAAVKFDSTDWGWIIMSIGMAIGAGIVFLPVQVGLVGVWVYLFSAIIAYPAIYLLQRLCSSIPWPIRRGVKTIPALSAVTSVKTGASCWASFTSSVFSSVFSCIRRH